MKDFFVFDLDGTLTNTVNTISYFVNSTLSEYGIEAIETEKFKVLAGDGARNLIKRSLGLRLKSWDENFELEVLKKYNEAYDADFTKLCEVYDFIPEALGELKKRSKKLSVLTNKPHSTALKTIDTFFQRGTFDLVIGQREGLPLKPDPAGVFEIIRAFNTSHERGIYVGDTATDMKTGKSANLFTIGVLWGFRGREELEKAGADAIICNPMDLLNFV